MFGKKAILEYDPIISEAILFKAAFTWSMFMDPNALDEGNEPNKTSGYYNTFIVNEAEAIRAYTEGHLQLVFHMDTKGYEIAFSQIKRVLSEEMEYLKRLSESGLDLVSFGFAVKRAYDERVRTIEARSWDIYGPAYQNDIFKRQLVGLIEQHGTMLSRYDR